MCRLFKVTGKVQGVFFRASTRDVAVPLGITGHAINLADSSVEVRACGDESAVATLLDWLHEGPRHAVVAAVTETPTECTQPGRFTTA